MKQNYEEAVEALDKRLTDYLSTEGLISIEAASEEQLKSLLSAFIKDFLEYRLYFEKFSSLCEEILKVLQNRPIKNHIDDTDSNLFMVCHYGAELDWYIRNDPARAGHFVERIFEWYKENSA